VIHSKNLSFELCAANVFCIMRNLIKWFFNKIKHVALSRPDITARSQLSGVPSIRIWLRADAKASCRMAKRHHVRPVPFERPLNELDLSKPSEVASLYSTSA
jgi:hypothetical protein